MCKKPNIVLENTIQYKTDSVTINEKLRFIRNFNVHIVMDNHSLFSYYIIDTLYTQIFDGEYSIHPLFFSPFLFVNARTLKMNLSSNFSKINFTLFYL